MAESQTKKPSRAVVTAQKAVRTEEFIEKVSEDFALELSGVGKILDRKEVLKDVSFSVRKGEVFGFLGPNGAGKTTTMKCVLALIEKDSGFIRVLGNEGLPLETKARIGFMPENTYLYKYLTGREFLRFSGNFFHLPKNVLESRIEALLIQVGLEKAADNLLSKYSKGMLQRVGLAQAIVNEPEIVFLDEPMSGLDPLGRKMVKDLILELKGRGATVVFNTHILSDVESICDHFAIIHKGIIIADERTSELKEPLEDYFIRKVAEAGSQWHEIR